MKYGPNTKLVEEFLTELKTAKYWLNPDGKPLPAWKLFEDETLNAARGTAWDAAWDAAQGTAWGAAWDAAWDAARGAAWGAAGDAARDAARGAARDAARDAAWDAARDAARDAAWDAALDAALFARCLVVLDLKVDFKHFAHANARMQVWRKGYCLKCDVNGVFYVYAKKGVQR